MSFEITTAFVEQFKSAVDLKLQAGGSKIRPYVMEESVTGDTAWFEQIGATEVQDVASRHGDSPLVSTPHDRRKCVLQDKEWGDMIDKLDRVRTLIDPTNPYVTNARMAFGRSLDSIILTAMNGTAYSGHTGATANTLATANKVAINYVETGSAANSGLTVGKLRRAKAIMDDDEVPEDDGNRHIAVTATQLHDLLQDPEVTSSDYNTVKALVNGEINQYLGFNFHRISSGILPASSTTRQCLAWHRNGVKLGVGMDVTARVAERADKRFSWYAYLCMSFGAVRLQEEYVVQISCDES